MPACPLKKPSKREGLGLTRNGSELFNSPLAQGPESSHLGMYERVLLTTTATLSRAATKFL
jgi:hypothetical protein